VHAARPINHILAMARLAMVLATAGRASPAGVRHLDPKQVQRTLTANVLSSDEVIAPTAQILNRVGLMELFRSEPAKVLTLLHKGLPTENESDRLFALAELSFAYASKSGPKSNFLASALYAYAFLFPKAAQTAPLWSDPRTRVALDLYNRGIAEAFTVADGNNDESSVLVTAGALPSL
jgi:hypothetical protein